MEREREGEERKPYHISERERESESVTDKRRPSLYNNDSWRWRGEC